MPFSHQQFLKLTLQPLLIISIVSTFSSITRAESSGASLGQVQHDTKLLHEGEMSMPRYLVSGAIGAYVGFGTGHAIQGRWLENGWIFTSGELATGMLGFAHLIGCGSNHSSDPSCGKASVLLTAFIGFRLWEIFDVWYQPYAHDQKVRELKKRQSETVRFFSIPRDGSMLAGFSFEF